MTALAQIVSLLAESDFYSAHQKARTSAARLLAAPRRAPAPSVATPAPTFDKKAQEAAELLWETSRRLLEAGQIGSGADLAGLLVNTVWDSRGVSCGETERGESGLLLRTCWVSGWYEGCFRRCVGRGEGQRVG